MDSIINSTIPPFSLFAYHDGIFKTITETDVLGKWNILFFYSADFSPTCAKELTSLADKQDEFEQIDVRIFAINTDSHFVHKAWFDRSEDIQKIRFPMLADRSGSFSKALGAMNEQEIFVHPATFVANPAGEIKIAEMYNESLEREASELIRKVKAAIFVAEHPGEACPASWQEGDESLKPSIDLIGKI